MNKPAQEQDLKKIRAQRLREARKAAGYDSMAEAAHKNGWKINTYMSHEIGRREFDQKTAHKYANAFDADFLHIYAVLEMMDGAPDLYSKGVIAESAAETIFGKPSSRPTPNASFPPTYQKFSGEHSVPLLGQSSAGPNGRFIMNGAEIGRVFCPPMLEGVEGAYAVRVYGTSMEPRFMPGETVWLNPHEPVRAGDDVVAQILVEGEEMPESYIKRFKSQSVKTLRLWQHNPDEGEEHELDFDSADVFSVHKVVFHAMI